MRELVRRKKLKKEKEERKGLNKMTTMMKSMITKTMGKRIMMTKKTFKSF